MVLAAILSVKFHFLATICLEILKDSWIMWSDQIYTGKE